MKHKAIPAALLLALSHSLLAQTQETVLEPVIVTANRVARTADETLAAITVITRKDIETQQGQTVAELLNGTAGIGASNSGGAGKVTSLYLRGTNSDHLLVLIDGTRIGSATLGTVALENIPVDQIERIEIVRGPRASLYGADAIGGVLQIFTRKGARTSLSISAGSHSTYGASANLGLKSESAWISAGINGMSTRGINACKGSSAYACFTNEPDRDGYRNASVNLRGGWQASERFLAELQVMETDAHNEFDGSSYNESTNQQQLLSGNLNAEIMDAWTARFSAAYSRDGSESFKDGVFKTAFNTIRNTIGIQNNFRLALNHSLVAGIEHNRDAITGTEAFTVRQRSNDAVFTQYLGAMGDLSLEAAIRHDDNETFGAHDTWSIATGYAFSPSFRLRASHGTAFKAPTFNQLYYPLDAYGWVGNADLRPESSRSTELSASGALEHLHWQANVFQTEITDLIQWVMDPTTYAGSPANVAKAKISGLELIAGQRWENTRIQASLTLLDPRDSSGNTNDGKLLTRRARHSGRLDLNHDIDKWSFGASMNGVGKRFDDEANKKKLGGYATLDLRAEYRIDETWRIQTRIENVLDKHYETAYGYDQPGIGAFVTLRYQPK